MQVRRLTPVAALLVSASLASAVAQENGLIVKPSAHGVIETVDRLERILDEKGIDVMARIDHAENALKVGKELKPTELLVFGNPNLGTPLMESARSIAIDLPMKALAWEDEEGRIWLAYNDPRWLAARHGAAGEDEIIRQMSGALDQITDGATAE